MSSLINGYYLPQRKSHNIGNRLFCTCYNGINEYKSVLANYDKRYLRDNLVNQTGQSDTTDSSVILVLFLFQNYTISLNRISIRIFKVPLVYIKYYSIAFL